MIEFILGLFVGGYLVMGLFNAAMYVLGTSIVSLGSVNTRHLFMHFIAWPLYRAW